MDSIPVFFCVDVEPDEGTFSPDDPSPWRGFEVLWSYMGDLRTRLTEATGEPVRYLWLLRMDPQIEMAYGSSGWAAQTYGRLFEEAQARGDALGVHPHAWRWDRPTEGWIADHANAPWVERCVADSFEAFRSHFGYPAELHRFGGRWISEETLDQVERLGARFDLTPEPGEHPVGPGDRQGASWTGWLPDYGPVPQAPYHPSSTDFRVPSDVSDGGLWVIPLTSGRQVPRRSWHRTTASRLRHPMRSARGVARRLRGEEAPQRTGPSHRLLAMWLPWRSPQDFWASVAERLGEIDLPYLAFAIRSDILIRTATARTFKGIMDHLFETPLAGRLAFTTPADGLARLGLKL